MSGCTNCGQPKPEDQLLLKAKQDAKQDAILTKTPMAIYQTTEGYEHGDAFKYNAAAGYRVVDVVSQYS